MGHQSHTALAPEAPASNIAAPAPQGTLGDKKLRVLMFDHDVHNLKSQMAACAAQGHKPVGVLVFNPSLSDSFTPERLTSFAEKQEVDHIIFSAQEAKALADAAKPNVIITTAMSDRCIFSSNQSTDLSDLVTSMELSDLMTMQIPNILPAHIPMLVNTVSGYTIHRQDGKDGQAISDRHINLNEFLKKQAAKIAAQGHVQG